MNWVIYVLRCPRTNAIRYVGKTTQIPRNRLRTHIAESQVQSATSARNRWVASLVAIGLRPTIEVVESGSGNAWKDSERWWIAFYRTQGVELTNGTPEQNARYSREGQARRTPEQRSEASRKANAAQTPEARSEKNRKWQARRTPEQRSESMR